MTAMTAPTATKVVAAEIIISRRTRDTMRAAAGSRGRSSSDGVLLMTDHPPDEVVTVTAEARERLDRLLAAGVAGVSRTRLKALILEGQVSIGGGTIRDPGFRVNAGDAVTVRIPPPEPAEPQGEAIALTIVHE